MNYDPQLIRELRDAINKEKQEIQVAEHKKSTDIIMALTRNIYLSAIDVGYTDEQAFAFSYAAYLNQLQQTHLQQVHKQIKNSNREDDKSSGKDGKKQH